MHTRKALVALAAATAIFVAWLARDPQPAHDRRPNENSSAGQLAPGSSGDRAAKSRSPSDPALPPTPQRPPADASLSANPTALVLAVDAASPVPGVAASPSPQVRPAWRPDAWGRVRLTAPHGAAVSEMAEHAHATPCSYGGVAELSRKFAGSGIDFSKPLPPGTSFPPAGPRLTVAGARGAPGDEAPPAGPLAPISTRDLRGLTGSNYVHAVLTSDGLDSTFFSTSNTNTLAAFAEARVQEIVDGLRAELAAGSIARATNIYRGLYYPRAASYVEFYSSQVAYSPSLHSNVIALTTAIGELPELLDPGFLTPRAEWAVISDSWHALSEQAGLVTTLLRRYLDTPSLQNLDTPANRTENTFVFNLLDGIQRTANQDGKWAGRYTPEFMQALSDFALVLPDTDDIRFAINNGIYTLGNLRTGEPVSAVGGRAHQILSQVLQVRAVDGEPYLTALSAIEDRPYNSRLADGTRFDITRYRRELEARIFSNTFRYDNGTMIFRTPLDAKKVARLYDALREVKAQFYRVTQALRPRDGDTNAVLTLRIYGTKSDYQRYQRFLYRLGTDNGGIYIENWATFFTFERTPQESIYTLEELTRHEYVHYLDGYSLLTPRFGNSPWYDNDRLTWHSEGFAEFLNGSRRTNGVPVRARMLSGALSTAGGPMSIRDIIGVGYNSGFGFYPNSAMFFGFLHERHPELLWPYFRALYTNSIPAYTALTQGWRNNPALQTE